MSFSSIDADPRGSVAVTPQLGSALSRSPLNSNAFSDPEMVKGAGVLGHPINVIRLPGERPTNCIVVVCVDVSHEEDRHRFGLR